MGQYQFCEVKCNCSFPVSIPDEIFINLLTATIYVKHFTVARLKTFVVLFLGIKIKY